MLEREVIEARKDALGEATEVGEGRVQTAFGIQNLLNDQVGVPDEKHAARAVLECQHAPEDEGDILSDVVGGGTKEQTVTVDFRLIRVGPKIKQDGPRSSSARVSSRGSVEFHREVENRGRVREGRSR